MSLEGGLETLRWQCGITATSRGHFGALPVWFLGHLRTSALPSVNTVPLQQAHERLPEACSPPGQAQAEMRPLCSQWTVSGLSVAGLRPRLLCFLTMYLVKAGEQQNPSHLFMEIK